MIMPANPFQVSNEAEIPSPSLLVYPDRIFQNLERMLQIAGGPERLRPHVKTHKLPEVVGMQISQGIKNFKCATIAECEMTAGSGARDVLLAHQPTGPNAARLRFLAERFPRVTWGAVVDDAGVVRILSDLFAGSAEPLRVYLDLDCGMRRSGIAPGEEAFALCETVASAPGLELAGLHAYDGHNHEPNVEKRTAQCESDFALVLAFQKKLRAAGMLAPNLVAGGSPTFPIHAQHADRECSPGTTILWDAGYGRDCADLPFEPAAALLTRVISKPGDGRLCFDLGHKAVAADKPLPRACLLGLEDATHSLHSEEHLALETSAAKDWAVGDCAYAIPEHICPTVALHDEVWVVTDGEATTCWEVSARRRRLGI
jgi:D-serine deaminase-like pyridoxal phosphate-dependent protein